MEGASELIAELDDAGATVILASSAQRDELDRYVELLGAGAVEVKHSPAALREEGVDTPLALARWRAPWGDTRAHERPAQARLAACG